MDKTTNDPKHKKKIGALGENMACRFLVEHGFRILDRNYNKKWGEIDIVAEKDKIFRFIEVKTVVSSSSSPACRRGRADKYETKLKSGCRESNSAYLLPKQAYYQYTTPRIALFYLNFNKKPPMCFI